MIPGGLSADCSEFAVAGGEKQDLLETTEPSKTDRIGTFWN